jgi:7-keto-8-aminopelargonate synthetase-like enzyme
VHACIVDAARLSGARLRVFRHNDPSDLERILRWADRQSTSGSASAVAPAVRRKRPRVLVVTESIFSMDGDQAPLRALVELKDRWGAWLMVDEAHATGLFGPGRRGLSEAEGVADRIEIQMGTLGKALGAAGGYICGPRPLIDLLINRARSFIFSTAPVPAAAAAATAAIRLVQSPEGGALCEQLWSRVDEVRRQLPAGPWRLLPSRSAILPLVVGGEQPAVAIAAELRARGVFIPAIRYPTVARGRARLRLTVTATHTGQDLAELFGALAGAAAANAAPHAAP